MSHGSLLPLTSFVEASLSKSLSNDQRGRSQVQVEVALDTGTSAAVSPTIEFLLGNRLICSSQTARQISRAQRAALINQSNIVPTLAGPGTVCNAEIPTVGCNFTRSADQTSLVHSHTPPPDPSPRSCCFSPCPLGKNPRSPLRSFDSFSPSHAPSSKAAL